MITVDSIKIKMDTVITVGAVFIAVDTIQINIDAVRIPSD
jgi:hypothetical protein